MKKINNPLDVSASAFRDLQSKNQKEKKEWRALMEESLPIQQIYLNELKEKGKKSKDVKGVSGSGVEASKSSELEIKEGEAMEYDESFYEKYSNASVVEKLIFESSANRVPVRLYISQLAREHAEAISRLPAHIRFLIRNKGIGIWGAAHVGFQIGNKLVHFLDNHFVKIQEVKARNALYVSKLSKSGEISLSPKLKTKVAEVVVKWNTTMMYEHGRSNCQHFIEDIVKEINSCLNGDEEDKLNTDLSEGNPKCRKLLDTVLKEPQNAGFKFYFDAAKKEVVFEDHSCLDEFELQNKDRLTKDDITFLKGFHRAFQMREKCENFDHEPECVQGKSTLASKPADQLFHKDAYVLTKYKKEFNKERGEKYEKSFWQRYFQKEGVKAYIFSPPKANSLHDIDLFDSWEAEEPTRSEESSKLVPIRLFIFKGNPNENDLPETLQNPHVGIQIDNKVLRFCTDFVDVVPFEEARALYITSLSEKGGLVMSEGLKEAVAEVVQEWNVKYQYLPQLTNALEFVKRVCSRINYVCKPDKTEFLDADFGKESERDLLDLVERFSLDPEDQPQKSEGLKQFEIYFNSKQVVELSSTASFRKWLKKNAKALNANDYNRHFSTFIRGFGYALQLNELLDAASK